MYFPLGDVIVEITLDVIRHRTFELDRSDVGSGADATGSAVLRTSASPVATQPAKDVRTVGQGERPMRRVDGNHAQRMETFVAVHKFEAVRVGAIAAPAAAIHV